MFLNKFKEMQVNMPKQREFYIKLSRQRKFTNKQAYQGNYALTKGICSYAWECLLLQGFLISMGFSCA